MFWRKKSDGFDWHKHVRTTIKLRREARKQKIDGAVDLAVGGVKGAGKAGVSASAAGLDALNKVIAAPIILLSRAITALLGGISKGLGWLLAPAGRLTERRGLAPILGLVATIAGLLGLARARIDGWDPIALALSLGSLAIFIALLGPPLFSGRGSASLRAFTDRTQALLQRLPGASSISLNARRGITAVLLLTVLGGGGWLSARAIANLPSASLAAIPGLSRPAVEGVANAVSGDTLRLSGQLVRLAGIEAPETEQSCGDGQTREKRWKCGDAARTALREAVRNKSVRCETSGTDDRGAKLATCRAGTTDIAAELVTRGHVFAQPGLFSTYGRLEQDARNAKRGIWRGTAERPSEFRNRHWETAKKTAPDGCPIKGQIKRNERVYVVPWSSQYRGVAVRKERGERWFCSEAEAQAAGWRPPASRRDQRAS